MDRRLAIDAVSSLPGSTATAFVVRSAGALRVCVVVKATFAFAADAAMPRVRPQEIFRQDVHHGKSAARSVRFTTDIVPPLGRADVLFTGYGYSHAGPVESLRVRLAIFDAQQTFLNKGLILKDPSRFERMPIVYERALGGPSSADNPGGVVEPTIVHPRDPLRAAGFGPISRVVPARAQRLGATPRDVIDSDSPDIPEGFDWSYFQAAPADQQIGYLRGDEWIALDGLHLDLPRFQTMLPSARGHAGVYGVEDFGTPDGFSVEMHADTLRIDGGEQRCTLVWRGTFPIADEAALASLKIVAGVDTEGAARDAPAPRDGIAARPASPPEIGRVAGAVARTQGPPAAQQYERTMVLAPADAPVRPPASPLAARGRVPVAPVGQVAVASVISRWRGNLRVTAVAKATFGLVPKGEMPLLAPVPILVSDVHHGDNPMRSIRETSDLAPHRERVDVVFVGHAHAPAGGPEARVAVRLAVAGDGGSLLDKRLDVVGDRSGQGKSPAPKSGAPVPFQKMPIVYERAFGGIGDRDNPLGIGLGSKEAISPNVVYSDPERANRTAGFGPIGTSWPARRALLGGHSAKLLKAPIIELPDDFAWAYFQAAPDDQRIADLPPRAWLLLEGLHPQHAVLHMRFPQVRVTARLHGLSDAVQTVVLRADTLFIDGDAERCTVTFRGSFTVPSVEALEGLYIQAALETPAQPVVWPAPPSAAEVRAMSEAAPRAGASAAAAEPLLETIALVPSAIPRAPPLPFVTSGPPSSPRSASSGPIPGAPWAQAELRKPVPIVTSSLESTMIDRGPAEPIAVAPPPPALVPMAAAAELPAAIEPIAASPEPVAPAEPPAPVVHAEPPAPVAHVEPQAPAPKPVPAEPERRADPWAPQPEPSIEIAPKAAPRGPVLPRSSSQPLPKKPLYGKFGKS